jgi:hypothetical protein
MKNYKILIGLFLILTAFTITSCTNEPIDSAIDLDDFNQQCDIPTAFQASNFINNNSVSLSWVAGGDESEWTVQYGIQGFALGSGTSIIANTTTYVVTGLNSTNSYSFYVKSNCSAESSSQWVGPINVQAIQVNPICSNPSNLTVVRNNTTNTTVNLSWTAGGTETSWEIQYGATGFSVGSGTNVVSTTTTKQISNILTTNAYDFYVRAKCSANQNSNWIGPINVAIVSVIPTTPPTYMNATVNGQSLIGMKPYFYPFTGLKAKLDIGSAPTNKILFVQGDTDPLNTNPSNFIQISIKINQMYWTPGTYVINPDNPVDPDKIISANLIIVTPPTNTWEINENELQGTITIIEFNPTTKRIKGTFSFPYMLINNSVSTGPFQVTNGSFDFEIEDAVFQ